MKGMKEKSLGIFQVMWGSGGGQNHKYTVPYVYVYNEWNGLVKSQFWRSPLWDGVMGGEKWGGQEPRGHAVRSWTDLMSEVVVANIIGTITSERHKGWGYNLT